MRHLVPLAFALGFASLCVAGVKQRTSGFVDTYEVDLTILHQEQRIVENVPFAVLSLPELGEFQGTYFDAGNPLMPAFHIAVSGDGDISVEPGSEWLTVPLRSDIASVLPSLPPLPRVRGAHRTLPKWETLSNTEYPGQVFSIGNRGSEAGIQTRVLAVYPVQFQASTRTLRLLKNFRVRVERRPIPARTTEREAILFVVGKPYAESPALRTYRDFKEHLGYDTSIHIVPAVNAESSKAIRNAVRAWYARTEAAKKYVLLVGDDDVVPGYRSKLVEGATDHFYRAIDTDNYMSDIGAPDVALGRISADDDATLDTIFRRLIRYTRADFSATSWLKRASAIATDDPENVVAAETALLDLIVEHLTPLGFVGNFPNTHETGADRLFAIAHKATGFDVLKSVRDGRGFITYGGHGSVDQWDGPIVTREQLEALEPSEAMPLVTSHSCYNGQYTGQSLAEAWLQSPGGAAFVWASTDMDFWDEGDILQRQFYAGVFREGRREFGQMTNHAVRDFWIRHNGTSLSAYYWETYNSFGDPAMAFHMHAPRELRLQKQEDALELLDSHGKAAAEARAAFLGPNGARAIRYSDRNGRVTLPTQIRPNRVVITGSDIRMLEANL